MKKTILKASFKLKILNDGSTYYNWMHPWKNLITLTNKDITLHPLWLNKNNLNSNNEENSYILDYTKKFKSKENK